MKAKLEVSSFAYDEVKRALFEADQSYRLRSLDQGEGLDLESLVLVPKPLDEFDHEKRVALDFDGVIHEYVSPWTDTLEIHDKPVAGAFEFIRTCFSEGLGIAIHTSRANDVRAAKSIQSWLLMHGLESSYVERMTITASKPSALVYIDDRGYRFEGHWPTLEVIRSLKQWNKRRI
jgi:hypothetical protein